MLVSVQLVKLWHSYLIWFNIYQAAFKKCDRHLASVVQELLRFFAWIIKKRKLTNNKSVYESNNNDWLQFV